jgi:hypothetical protein
MKLCSEDKPLFARLLRLQRDAKRIRNDLNRHPLPRVHDWEYRHDHPSPLSILNEEIRTRRLRLMELAFCSEWHPADCSMCRMRRNYKYNVFTDCLRSSTEEHLIRNQDVVGSIPAGGSK